MRKNKDVGAIEQIGIEIIISVLVFPVTLLMLCAQVGFALFIHYLTGININTCLILVVLIELGNIEKRTRS